MRRWHARHPHTPHNFKESSHLSIRDLPLASCSCTRRCSSVMAQTSSPLPRRSSYRDSSRAKMASSTNHLRSVPPFSIEPLTSPIQANLFPLAVQGFGGCGHRQGLRRRPQLRPQSYLRPQARESPSALSPVGMCIIFSLPQACDGDLERVTRVVKLGGFVNCMPNFGDQPKCINGASDLMVEVFGPMGRHARAAVGVASLPFGAIVEIDAVFEIAWPSK